MFNKIKMLKMRKKMREKKRKAMKMGNKMMMRTARMMMARYHLMKNQKARMTQIQKLIKIFENNKWQKIKPNQKYREKRRSKMLLQIPVQVISKTREERRKARRDNRKRAILKKMKKKRKMMKKKIRVLPKKV
jgi:hypothetical protein